MYASFCVYVSIMIRLYMYIYMSIYVYFVPILMPQLTQLTVCERACVSE